MRVLIEVSDECTCRCLVLTSVLVDSLEGPHIASKGGCVRRTVVPHI